MKNLRTIIAVARMTIADVLRQKSFIALFIVAVLFVLLTRGCWGMKMNVNGQVMSGGKFALQILQTVFFVISSMVMFIAGLLAMRLFRRDRDEGMQAFVLSKPVTRLSYITGKVGGLVLIMTAFMFLLHGAILIIHFLHSGEVTAGYLAASFMSILNVAFAVLAVSLLSLLIPDIFAFLAAFGVTALAFFFDVIAAAARSSAAKSILSQSGAQVPGMDSLTWWQVVYWIWPKAGALGVNAAALIDPTATIAAYDVLIPIASIAAYCIVFSVLVVLRFQREEIV